MRPVNNETRITMNKRRNFVNYATMTLYDGTVLHLTPSDFRISGNTFTDDWCDGGAFQLGSVIGKTATILLDNTDGRTEVIGTSTVTYPHGKFSEYDFYMAYFQLFVCLPDAYHYGGQLRDEMIEIGTFTVTTPVSRGATIEITGVDNMYMFDKSFDDCDLDFTTNPTLSNILVKCCEDCGVAIGWTTFSHSDWTVSKKPEGVTYRQVVSYVAQIAGCNAVISKTGALTLKWYDMSTFYASWLDGGSFTEIGTEFLYMNKFTWSSGSATGYNIFYDRVPRSGKYEITRVVIDGIENPSTFDGYFEVDRFNSFRDSVNNGTEFSSADGRLGGKTILTHVPLVEGENSINFEVDVTALNRINYWSGVGSESGTGSKFSCTIYMRPLSYSDGDSADGGTFEPEYRVAAPQTWTASGGSIEGDMVWFYTQYRCPQFIGPAGKYTITRIYIDEIADPSHFNAVYEVQKSTDAGVNWTTMQDGVLAAGSNDIDFEMDLPNSNDTRFRVRVGQDITSDPNASNFRIQQYFKANDTSYLDGDNFDGGSFTASLDYHNLTATNGTEISTDDIQFTGVLVSYDETSAHYPTGSGWDYYAMEITDNPFVVGHEYALAVDIYTDVLAGLKFRPFSCSSLQDPTIEAGDSAIVYDVKGNFYFSVITNASFKTGGMTELSCNAEPPVKQNSRYVNPAAQAVARAEKNMDDYNKQVAHFNEIANAALGYYKTVEADPQTGALITYLHDHAELENSENVVMITATGVFISDNYNTSRSWNSGLDTSTATLLMNLIYVHGLTADWVRTGELDVGGLNNEDGVIRVSNRMNMAIDGSATISGSATDVWLFIGPSQITTSGTYRVFYNISNVESGKDEVIQCQIQKRDLWGGSSYTYKVVIDNFFITDHYGEYPIRFDVDTSNGDKYYAVKFSRVVDTNAGFTVTNTYNAINTVIDRNGLSTTNGNFKGSISGSSISGGTISGTEITGGSLEIAKNNDKVRIKDGILSMQGTYIKMMENINSPNGQYMAIGSTDCMYNTGGGQSYQCTAKGLVDAGHAFDQSGGTLTQTIDVYCWGPQGSQRVDMIFKNGLLVGVNYK